MDDQSEVGYFAEGNATFGDRVEAGRVAAELSQQELAHKLGVKLKTVRGWEEDIAEPRANKLQMMAGLMNVSIMWLLTGEGDGVLGPDEAHDSKNEARIILAELSKTRAEIAKKLGQIARLEARLSKVLNNG
ncbi:MAG: helix-turn-helix domain-containing protein [Litoreibacter sp.]